MDIFHIATTVLISIFVLALIWIMSVNIIGANIYPMLSSENFKPTNETGGISETQYQSTLDFMWNGTRWFFYILIAIPFIYIIIKLLYSKEETSVYWR